MSECCLDRASNTQVKKVPSLVDCEKANFGAEAWESCSHLSHPFRTRSLREARLPINAT